MVQLGRLQKEAHGHSELQLLMPYITPPRHCVDRTYWPLHLSTGPGKPSLDPRGHR